MRLVGVHADVVVVTSRVWQTSCMAVRDGDEAFVVDSPVYPDELEALPSVLERASFGVRGLLVTHADWDHLLGRYAFPAAALGCAETTAARLRAEPGTAQRELRAFDEGHYVERPGPLSLGSTQSLPVPGKCEVGGRELELYPAGGHTADGMAVLAPWAGVLACGDYLSPVEIPILSASGSLGGYLATLDLLCELAARVETVVPGHGSPLSSARALELAAEDEAYLDALGRRGRAAELPPGRRSAEQRGIHAQNVARLEAAA